MGIITEIFNVVSIKKGSVLGAVLLLSGSCIGAGILAVPILTGFAGSVPTAVIFILSMLYMTATALLLLEALLAYPYCPNIISLSGMILGKKAKGIAWLTFLSLFYSLIIAYIAKGGDLIHYTLVHSCGVQHMPSWFGAFVLASISCILIYFGTWIVDHFNRICMYLLLFSFVYFLANSLSESHGYNLMHRDWSYCLFIVPFIITSFGFHNMLPTLNEYLSGQKNKLVFSICLSGLFVFSVYLFWTLSMHSILPLEGDVSITTSFQKGEIITQPLMQLLQAPSIQYAASSLAFFAIVTSLLAQALSLVDFLSDGLSILRTVRGRFFLCILIFFPSFLFSQMFPGIFFHALEFVGGIAAMILFGILPSLLVWKIRYTQECKATPILPGGKITLLCTMFFSCLIIFYELQKHF